MDTGQSDQWDRAGSLEGGRRWDPATGVNTPTISVVITVLNDAAGCEALLNALGEQTRTPDEIVFVDGGSTDQTRECIRTATRQMRQLRLIELPGANISRGRNVGIAAARGDVIALTDCGCRPAADWLHELTQPFRLNANVRWVGGAYSIDPHSLFERVVGLATMRGQLDPIDPKTFNPSARSMAFFKATWRRAGGFPEWLYTAEDTLFDVKLRRMGVAMHLAPRAVVAWRPRSTWRALARQFYFYGRGGGHARLGARNSCYNIRNAILLLLTIPLGLLKPSLWLLAALVGAYFFICPWHGKCFRIARQVRSGRAYVIALATHWVVAMSDAIGYIAGSVQRGLYPRRYHRTMIQYLNPAPASDGPLSFKRPPTADSIGCGEGRLGDAP
ncbi:MAG: glycosyltransferase [Phycisphaerales bacterium]|nr:glycosyltransferase [Phycisphaerales bacterium]